MKNNREHPILYKTENDCCGCTACVAVCPVNAINMVKNKKGFLYPVIDKDKCIKCYSCIKVCPLKDTVGKKYEK